MQEVWSGYDPRQQFIPFHTRTQRWSALVCHRRAGKTVACVADLIDAALQCELPDPRFAYIAPFFVQAKDIAWSYLKRYTQNIVGVQYNEAELRVDLPNGGRIRLYGADNYERLRGIYLDGVILDEYGDMPPSAWSEVIRPSLSDRKGWAVFIGTPKGRNHFWQIFNQGQKDPENWYTVILKASETNLIERSELIDAQATMTPEQYQQEFECSFQAALLGSYYGKELNQIEADGQVTSVAAEKSLQTYTCWDLGIDDATAIWFIQMVGNEIRFVDYYENSGCALDHYVKVLKEKPYIYAEHYLPHDVRVKELGTGRSRLETLESLGLTVTVCDAQSVEDGINAVRLMLPRCWFDVTKTDRGLEALRQYQRDYDDKLMTFKNRPRHDWASHAADAVRGFAMQLPETKQKYRPRVASGGWMTA